MRTLVIVAWLGLAGTALGQPEELAEVRWEIYNQYIDSPNLLRIFLEDQNGFYGGTLLLEDVDVTINNTFYVLLAGEPSDWFSNGHNDVFGVEFLRYPFPARVQTEGDWGIGLPDLIWTRPDYMIVDIDRHPDMLEVIVRFYGTTICADDFNMDGTVNTTDFLAFMNAYQNGHPWADVNRDGVIDTRDVAAYLSVYQEGCV